MKRIDEARLETDLPYRFQYVTEFMGLGAQDIETILGAAPLLAPLVPGLVDAIYVQLFNYDCTKRHFVPRQFGYEGAIPESLETLTLDHPQIAFRKAHLGAYLKRLVTGPYDGKMIEFLDMVGKIHTRDFGNKRIDVPLVQMNALMGFVSDALVNAILDLNLPPDVQRKALRAFNKLLWVQNDLIVRHYARH